jgi:hypothetical protein
MVRKVWMIVLGLLCIGAIAPINASAAAASQDALASTCESICVAIAPDVQQKPLKDKAFADAKFKKLRKFLESRGYIADFTQVKPVIVSLNSDKAKEKGVSDQYVTVSVPFTTADSEQGFVTLYGNNKSWDVIPIRFADTA